MLCNQLPRARQADFNDGAGPILRACTAQPGITTIRRLQESLPSRCLAYTDP